MVLATKNGHSNSKSDNNSYNLNHNNHSQEKKKQNPEALQAQPCFSSHFPETPKPPVAEGRFFNTKQKKTGLGVTPFPRSQVAEQFFPASIPSCKGAQVFPKLLVPRVWASWDLGSKGQVSDVRVRGSGGSGLRVQGLPRVPRYCYRISIRKLPSKCSLGLS